MSEVLIEALTLLSAASTVTVEPETYRAPGESSQTTADDTSSTVPCTRHVPIMTSDQAQV